MSIVKVAELAGVSKSTVSMVINNHPTVVPATAARVRAAMQKLGYSPGLRENRRGPKPNSMYPERSLNLALVTLGIPREILSAPLYNDVLFGAMNRAQERAHRLTIHHIPKAREFNADAVYRMGVDGFLLFGSGETEETSQALREFPCVSLMGAQKVRDWCDWVSYDDIAIGQKAASFLLERAHRNCVFIGDSGWPRGKAFTKSIRAAGCHASCVDPTGVIQANADAHKVNQSTAIELVQHLANLRPRPTAIFVWSDIMTAALYPRLRQFGLEPGRNLTVVSCNNEWPLLIGLHPRPVVLDVQGSKIGWRAMEQLTWRMQNRSEASMSVQLAPRLIEPSDEISTQIVPLEIVREAPRSIRKK